MGSFPVLLAMALEGKWELGPGSWCRSRATWCRGRGNGLAGLSLHWAPLLLVLYLWLLPLVLDLWWQVTSPRNLASRLVFNLFADYAEVDILEEEDISELGAQRFNLEWMQKVVYTIKPAIEQ